MVYLPQPQKYEKHEESHRWMDQKTTQKERNVGRESIARGTNGELLAPLGGLV